MSSLSALSACDFLLPSLWLRCRIPFLLCESLPRPKACLLPASSRWQRGTLCCNSAVRFWGFESQRVLKVSFWTRKRTAALALCWGGYYGVVIIQVPETQVSPVRRGEQAWLASEELCVAASSGFSSESPPCPYLHRQVASFSGLFIMPRAITDLEGASIPSLPLWFSPPQALAQTTLLHMGGGWEGWQDWCVWGLLAMLEKLHRKPGRVSQRFITCARMKYAVT